MRAFIDAHRSGETMWIDMLYVEPDQRRRGRGREMFRMFESELPTDVTMIRVFAADTEGSGNSDAFWLALGFAYRYEGDEVDMSYESAHTLVKGANGTPTPAPIHV